MINFIKRRKNIDDKKQKIINEYNIIIYVIKKNICHKFIL